ncbi:CHASE2 domain-containing protein [Trinickia violacea]|uniref:histidine kinase n=1 Tax=Trinickia violacea TaxID=2571746 RepID=A0A4P8J1W5_9BURK|nr:CHASE2 domain-containing protein [Trinickia violacea]QCP54365.1 CHASE2 domain-containing protein [Trinickia violacea]
MSRRFILEWLLIALLMAPLQWWLQDAPSVPLVDAMLYDWAMSQQRAAPSPDVLIVGIDARSLAELGPWPWPRKTHAQLLDTLAHDGARRVLLDFFLEEPSTNRDDDLRLAAALGRLPVYLPLRVAESRANGSNEPDGFVRPLPLFNQSVVATAHANVTVDADGVARWIFMREGVPGRLEPFVGTLLAGQSALAPSARTSAMPVHSDGWDHQEPFGFPLTQPLHGWHTVSYISLLRGQVPAEFVRGKLVLVGPLEDSHLERLVPVGVPGGAASLAGVELLADAVDALRHGRAIHLLPRLALAFSATVPIWLALTLFLPAARYSLAIVVCVAGSWLAISLLLLAYANVWLPPLPTLLGLTIAYFLWSWRRLSAFFQFFGKRIAMLNALPAGAFEPGGRLGAPAWDHVVAQMAALDAAINRVTKIKTMLSVSISQMPVAVLVCFDDGTITQSNDAARRLLEPSTVLHDATEDALSRRDLLSILRETCVTQLGGASSVRPWFETLHNEYVTQRGQVFKPRVAALDIFGDEPRRWMVALHDVTSEHRIKLEREQWIGYISHDLRTPQINIISLLNLYADGAAQLDERALIDGVRRETERSIRLADSILDLLTARSDRYRFEPVPVAALALDAVDQVWANAAAKNVTIDTRITDDDATLWADGPLLTRAFVNLLHNAIRHSASGDTIDVCVTVDYDVVLPRIHVAIRDAGEGMSQQHVMHLFESPPAIPSLHVNRDDDGITPRDDVRSHGMGIPMVLEIVARHEGHVTAHSLPGAGATFLIEFPVCVVER